jgi:predicted transcriptional regulator
VKARAVFESLSEAEDLPVKLSVNVSADVGQRLRRIAFEERLSESSIVEIALMDFFGRMSEVEVGSYLRAQGATLRRPRNAK